MTDINDRFQVLHEFVTAAEARLEPNHWDYLVGGAETETTQRRNRLALDRLAFRPRVLRDVSKIDLSSRFLGQTISLPIAVAPIGAPETFDPRGAAAVIEAAATAGIVSFHSSVSKQAFSQPGGAAPGTTVFQLYVRGDGDWIDAQVAEAEAAGFDAFCITVDTAIYSRRERDIANRFVKPWRTAAVGLEFQASFNWRDFERFQTRHQMPLILKGIATTEDACRAVDAGVAGVYISNHGGRQLDHGLGSIDLLAEIVAAVAGRATIIIDGGFMRGTDIVKAMALGADLVGLGRLPMFALAAAGSPGLVRAVDLLRAEIYSALGLLGVTNWSALDPSYVAAGEPVREAKPLSAFPLID